MADITFGEAYGEAQSGSVSGASVVHLAGGIVSLALIVGIGVWGGKIILRDVSGIPVVQAMSDGPMRVAPENPGGDVAAHAGLTVNDVAAQGEAAPPEDRLVLAPGGVDVAEEDLEVTPAAEAGEVRGNPVSVEPVRIAASGEDAPLSAEEVLALADRIASEAQALPEPVPQMDVDVDVDLSGGNAAEDIDPVEAALAEAVTDVPAPAPEVISTSIPGVKRSIRPAPRPGMAGVAGVTLASATSAGAAGIPVSGDLPVGTKLVQLGAYDSVDLARADWQRISARFADFMGGKSPVIQQAESGGRSFYRLRAQGFADISDARRFCAVLMAENAACIPVVVR